MRETDKDKEVEKSFYFSVPDDFIVHSDSVATCLATLAGRKYQEIEFNFCISRHCKATIEASYGVSIKCPDGDIPPKRQKTGVVLNFSGGFDSLSAHLLLPKSTELIAVDFGGAFAREKAFFQDYPAVNICETDFRSKGFAVNDWRFMGGPSVLYSDYLNAGTILFGSILEASEWNFSAARAKDVPRIVGPFGAAGLLSASPVRGLTELGTAMVILRKSPGLISRSLASLASPRSEKQFRKRLLMGCAEEYFSGSAAINIEDLDKPTERVKFGCSFAIDFLAYYLVSRFGKELMSNWIDDCHLIDTDGMSVEALNFYFKYNPNFIGELPASIKGCVLNKYNECGIEPYNELDWVQFHDVCDRLGRNWRLGA